MRRVIRFVVVLGMVTATAWLVHAQTPVPKNNPIEKAVTGATTPARVISEIEAAAKIREAGAGPTTRYQYFRVGMPDNANELNALRKYGVMLLVALSQKPEELPLKRVFIKTDSAELPLQKLSSARSDVDSKLLAYKIYGRYREDGFYLVAIGAMTRDGVIIAEFALPGVGINVLKLPSKAVVDRGPTFAGEPASGAQPDASALKALIERKFTGFAVPK